MIKIRIPEPDISIQKALTSSERVSITHFENYRDIPKTAGIYIFRNHSHRVIYVGKSANLKQRMSTHFYKSAHLKAIIHEVEYIDVWFVSNPMERAIYEIYMVNVFNSLYNAESKFFGDKRRVARKLRERN